MVPMPEREASCCAREWIWVFASSAIERRKVSGDSLPRSAGSNASAAILDATSPAWAPPIPSATANSGERAKYESSLAVRERPVSVR